MTTALQNARIEGNIIIVTLPGGIELKMVHIPSGKFQMGSTEYSSEQPVHEVSISEFQMAETLTTQAQWEAVAALPKIDVELKARPSRFGYQADLPVDSVNWFEAVEFCKRLSAYTGHEFSLPSEAQWEYAARAGTTTKYWTGDTVTTDQANFDGSDSGGIYRQRTTPVKEFRPNPWDLYDMIGNLFQWCQDTYHSSYEGAPTDGSAWVD